MNLVFATNNINKAKEIQHLVGKMHHIQTLKDIGCDTDIAETGTTIKENAGIKSRFVAENFNVNCFADDTGLLVDELEGAPGVHSARYAGEQKNENDNIALLLKKLEGKKNRNARFLTVIALIIDGKEFFFEGELKGRISLDKRGKNGFGYDPVFVPEGFNQTLAEVTLEEKNRISHRAIAFNKLLGFLKKD